MSKIKKKPTKKEKLKTHDYDHALKQIFSHPEMMESLIKGFVPEPWTHELDFGSLHQFNVKHVTDDLRDRENDIIWQIDFRGKPLFIICLVEFQSKVDHFMAIRVLTYTGLVYQDLIKQRALKAGDKLPPVFSLVFYTGDSAWQAPLTVKGCLNPAIPAGLVKYQPDIHYMIVDVGQIPIENYSMMENNLVLPIVELEQASRKANTGKVLEALVKKFESKQFDRLRKDFLAYITQALRLQDKFPDINVKELHEVSMLYERLEKAEMERRQQACQEAYREGTEKGIQKERFNMALLLLKKQTGEVTPATKQQLEKATAEELKALIDNMLLNEEIVTI